MEYEPGGDSEVNEPRISLNQYICVELIGDDDLVELKAVPRDEALAAGFFSHGILSDEVNESKLEALWDKSIDLPANWN